MFSFSFRAIFAIFLALAVLSFAAPIVEKRAIDPTSITSQINSLTTTVNGLLTKVQSVNTGAGSTVTVSFWKTWELMSDFWQTTGRRYKPRWRRQHSHCTPYQAHYQHCRNCRHTHYCWCYCHHHCCPGCKYFCREKPDSQLIWFQQFSTAIQNLLTALTASATQAASSTAALLPLQTVVTMLQTQINTVMTALTTIVGGATTAVASEKTAVSSALSSAVSALWEIDSKSKLKGFGERLREGEVGSKSNKGRASQLMVGLVMETMGWNNTLF